MANAPQPRLKKFIFVEGNNYYNNNHNKRRRFRKRTACKRCRRMKIRCGDKLPCDTCAQHNVSCAAPARWTNDSNASATGDKSTLDRSPLNKLPRAEPPNDTKADKMGWDGTSHEISTHYSTSTDAWDLGSSATFDMSTVQQVSASDLPEVGSCTFLPTDCLHQAKPFILCPSQKDVPEPVGSQDEVVGQEVVNIYYPQPQPAQSYTATVSPPLSASDSLYSQNPSQTCQERVREGTRSQTNVLATNGSRKEYMSLSSNSELKQRLHPEVKTHTRPPVRTFNSSTPPWTDFSFYSSWFQPTPVPSLYKNSLTGASTEAAEAEEVAFPSPPCTTTSSPP